MSFHQKKCERQALVINKLVLRVAKLEAVIAEQNELRYRAIQYGTLQREVALRLHAAVKEALFYIPKQRGDYLIVKHRINGKRIQSALNKVSYND